MIMKRRIIYQRANVLDYRSIANVFKACCFNVSDFASSEIVHYITAKTEGKIVAALGIEQYGKHALITAVGVIPEYRNMGIGRRMLLHTYQLAKNLQISHIHYFTEDTRFFQKLGFTILEREMAPFNVIKSDKYNRSFTEENKLYLAYKV